MNTSKSLVLVVLIVASTLLLSWDRSKNQFVFIPPFASCPYIVNSYEEDQALMDELSEPAYLADYDWLAANVNDKNHVPAAEDVLVQRIPGDEYHLLMMAVYSDLKQPAFRKEFAGAAVDFRDDGKGDDKVSGDGVYTAKIFADVQEFRKTAIEMDEATKKAGPVAQFQNRALYYAINGCNTEPFSAEKLDAYQAVSIAALSGGGSFNKLIDSVRKNCIFITDLKVVEDPTRTWNSCAQTGNVDGPWTFKTIFKELASSDPKKLANDSTVSAFVKNWLNNYAVKRVINTDTVNPRTFVTTKILNPWLTKSQAAGAPVGQLDMRFAPFKLTAIVNRFDIRERDRGIPAGEGRFTFCLINSDCTAPEEFTMVVEYGINKSANCDTLRNWASQWYNLKNLTIGSPEYNQALQNITDQYIRCGQNSKKPNKNCLNTVRTNERTLSSTTPARWEFRQFVLDSPTHMLKQTPLHKIFQDKYNVQVDNPDVRAMVAWVNANRKPINKDDYDIPDTGLGPDSITIFHYTAGAAHILDTPVGDPSKMNVYHWDGGHSKSNPDIYIKNTTTRQVFSLNSCTGCHAGEMQTFFTHVDPVFFGTQTTLSGFLTGTAGRGGAIDFDNNATNDSFMVKDAALRPALNPKLRMFNDILRRAKDLKDFVISPPCATAFALKNDLMFQPLGMVH